MANAGHVQTPVMTFFDLISRTGLSSLRAMLRNAGGTFVFRARSMTMNAARFALNFHWHL
jgi:hypothetical protein